MDIKEYSKLIKAKRTELDGLMKWKVLLSTIIIIFADINQKWYPW